MGGCVRNLLRHLVTESAVYGVIVVAGLVVIVADGARASWDVLVKVSATILVFWLAHVFAAAVAKLGAKRETTGIGLGGALAYALDHGWGMLVAAAIPLVSLLLGTLGVLDDQVAIWGVLWTAVVVLGVLGFVKAAELTPRGSVRAFSGVITATLGLILILLKAVVH